MSSEQQQYDNEISLFDVINLLKEKKLTVLFFAVVFIIAGIIVAIVRPHHFIYKQVIEPSSYFQANQQVFLTSSKTLISEIQQIYIPQLLNENEFAADKFIANITVESLANSFYLSVALPADKQAIFTKVTDAILSSIQKNEVGQLANIKVFFAGKIDLLNKRSDYLKNLSDFKQKIVEKNKNQAITQDADKLSLLFYASYSEAREAQLAKVQMDLLQTQQSLATLQPTHYSQPLIIEAVKKLSAIVLVILFLIIGLILSILWVLFAEVASKQSKKI